MEKKITKKDIEKLAVDIRKWARNNRLNDYSMLYNGKFWHHEYTGEYDAEGRWVSHKKLVIDKDQDPHKWCEWFPERFILGICADGSMWECLNGYNKYKAREQLDDLLKKYGLYLENCNGTCFSVEVGAFNIEEVEYTYWAKEKIIYLYGPNRSDYGPVLPELNTIMEYWYELSKQVGDHGCCTIGEYMEFIYKGTKYRMSAQSPYQGDYSWARNVPEIKKALENIGATNVWMNYGHMD